MSRTTIVDNDYITFYTDVVDGDLFVHVNIHVWSGSVYKQCLRIWTLFLNTACTEGYKYVYAALAAQDDRLKKFAELFGMYEIYQTERFIVMARNTK